MPPTIVLVHGAFAPEPGESAFTLAAMFPGSTLGDAVQPTPRADGTTDLTITQDRFHEQFCADVPAPQAARMAVAQRPVTLEALELEDYMAKRAGAHRTIEIPGASSAVGVAA